MRSGKRNYLMNANWKLNLLNKQNKASKNEIILPWKEGTPGYQGRLSLSGNRDGYMGKVVKGSISHNETLGGLSPAVDSSQPTRGY